MKIFPVLRRRTPRLTKTFLLAPVLCLLIAPGCTRKPLPKPPPPTDSRAAAEAGQSPGASPLPSTRRPKPLLPTTRTRTRALTPDANGLLEILGPPATPQAAARQAAELEREYKTEVEHVSRVESIYRLADASSPQSRQVLQSLFFAEKDLELRVQMVQSLSFVDSEDLAPSVPILQEALKASQPHELREAAIDTIQSLNDSRTLPLLQIPLSDPDPELRESALRTIEYYQEVLDLGKP